MITQRTQIDSKCRSVLAQFLLILLLPLLTVSLLTIGCQKKKKETAEENESQQEVTVQVTENEPSAPEETSQQELNSVQQKVMKDEIQYSEKERAQMKAPESLEFSSTTSNAEEKIELGGGGGGGTYGASSRSSEIKPLKRRTQQKQTWKQSSLTPHTSRLKIGDNESLPFKGMKVNVHIDGFRARVLIDQFYYNDHDAQLEGNVQLRLPDGAKPYFLAFGQSAFQRDYLPEQFTVNKDQSRPIVASMNRHSIMEQRTSSMENVKVARVVPPERAGEAYKKTVRRKVDPALMEWSGAGVFSTRVFPLQPNKIHRIVIGYDVNLLRTGSDWQYKLHLPPITENVTARIAVNGASAKSVIARPKTPAITNGRDDVQFTYENPNQRTIKIRIRNPEPVIMTGMDPQTGPYFATRFRPNLPEKQVQSPPEAVFLLDTSLSSQPDRFSIWLKLLQAILDENRNRIERFNVLFFNADTHWWKSSPVENTPEQVKQFIDYARQTVLEGATDLGQALKTASRAPGETRRSRSNEYNLFLLSDGSPTWGERKQDRLHNLLPGNFNGRLFAYQTGMSGTDIRMLRGLADETGGAVFSVTSKHEITSAATAHRNLPWTLTDVSVTGGSDLLIAGHPDVVYPDQSMILTGRGTPDHNATVQLTATRNGETKTFTTTPTKRIQSELAPRTFGQVAVNYLDAADADLTDVSQPFAQHFRVTGKHCSLLMLENEGDYEQLNLTPGKNAQTVRSTSVREITKQRTRSSNNLSSTPSNTPLFRLYEHIKESQADTTIPDELLNHLKKKPASFFRLDNTSLSARRLTKNQLPGYYTRRLADGEITYGPVMNESNRRHQNGHTDDALVSVSSLIEQHPGNNSLLRDVAYTVMSWGKRQHAKQLLHRAAMKRPEEPHTYFAIARMLDRMNRPALAMAYYELCVNGRWDNRFGNFNKIAMFEYRRFLKKHTPNDMPDGLAAYLKTRKSTRPFSSASNAPDLAVWILWNTDGTDVDLHVTEPTDETCYYENQNTKIGGTLTEDVTDGYGPELYTLPDAKPGSYQIRVKYYDSSDVRAGMRTRVYVMIYHRNKNGKLKATRKSVLLEEANDVKNITERTLQ